jgi:hypothetical protein
MLHSRESPAAAWLEAATRRQRGRKGHRALNRGEQKNVAINWRNAVEQAARVGLAWRSEDRVDRALFDDVAGIHHQHALRELGDDAEVVRDQYDRHAEFALQSQQQIEDLRLHGDVERRVGSSAINSLGCEASAIAIITRCRVPPDSSCG